MTAVPEAFLDLFERETIAAFTTLNPDDTPHTTPVWPDYDDGSILVNTERGRRKERNVRRNPAVSVLVWDPADVYRFVSVTGRVETVTEAGAVEHVDELARQYWGVSSHAERAGESDEPRVIIEVHPEHVMTSATSPSGGS